MPVKKVHCVINGQAVRSLEEFYGELTRQLPFPPHFGNNLDALWDVLTVDMAGPLRIIWEGAEVSRSAMGDDFERVLTLLRAVGKERKDITVTIR